jgi:hypothetical protein
MQRRVKSGSKANSLRCLLYPQKSDKRRRENEVWMREVAEFTLKDIIYVVVAYQG